MGGGRFLSNKIKSTLMKVHTVVKGKRKGNVIDYECDECNYTLRFSLGILLPKLKRNEPKEETIHKVKLNPRSHFNNDDKE